MTKTTVHTITALCIVLFAGCGPTTTTPESTSTPAQPAEPSATPQAAKDDHGHHHDDEHELGTFKAGEYQIEAAQGHGPLKAGQESHLIVKLPYNDKGASVVRAWIGSEDRTLSSVGKGEYAPSHNDYDIHAVAPSPLPEDALWWVEIEKPDGSKLIGSIAPQK